MATRNRVVCYSFKKTKMRAILYGLKASKVINGCLWFV
jgi:hypothetical protein